MTAPVRPRCHPKCPGFGIFNVPFLLADSPDQVMGGEVQSCDECKAYDDAEAIRIVRSFGCRVSREGLIRSVAPHALPALRILGCAPTERALSMIRAAERKIFAPRRR